MPTELISYPRKAKGEQNVQKNKTKYTQNEKEKNISQVWKKIRVWSTLKEIPRLKGLSPILLLADD